MYIHIVNEILYDWAFQCIEYLTIPTLFITGGSNLEKRNNIYYVCTLCSSNGAVLSEEIKSIKRGHYQREQ